ncbi:DUF2726 domain-containing protein [Aquabacterium sp. A7-Y]|uniref:DUF2726 domain-containing protein n=1 Tax=Aquabacterium sp. A7-Y TaxID=1349605 RepID=UPI00223D446E|nr:DUF2726 domain-containing protein [Aquabacterium sp. A7-Y]MCW7537471.1 DUF2726 domain-containing protein [Aquabacterium sp. A7-Y]
MQQAVLVVLAVAVLVLLAWVWTRRRKPAIQRAGKARGVEALDTLLAWTPQPTRILTGPEREAFLSLRKALPEHLVFVQVPLARFLKVPTRHSYAEWLRRVGQLCADLVICDMNSQVVAVVEVRQREEQESSRSRRRHARMDRVLLAAGIPLHVWLEDEIPAPAAIREALLSTPAGLTQDEGAATVSTRGGAGRRDAAGSRDTVPDGMEMTDPPPSTWFDDLESAPVPLAPTPAAGQRRRH